MDVTSNGTSYNIKAESRTSWKKNSSRRDPFLSTEACLFQEDKLGCLKRWSVVSTHLKNMSQIGSSSPDRGETRKYSKPPSRFLSFRESLCFQRRSKEKLERSERSETLKSRWFFSQRKLPLLGDPKINRVHCQGKVKCKQSYNSPCQIQASDEVYMVYTLFVFCFSASASLLVRWGRVMSWWAAVCGNCHRVKGHKLLPVCIYFSQKWKFWEAVIRNSHLYLMVLLMVQKSCTNQLIYGKYMVNMMLSIWSVSYHVWWFFAGYLKTHQQKKIILTSLCRCLIRSTYKRAIHSTRPRPGLH